MFSVNHLAYLISKELYPVKSSKLTPKGFLRIAESIENLESVDVNFEICSKSSTKD